MVSGRMLRAYLDEKGLKTAMIDDNLAMLLENLSPEFELKRPE
jgi:hypothetical protein